MAPSTPLFSRIPCLQRAWEEEVGNDDGDGDEASDVNATPSEAFLSLQKDLEEKEKIQKGNEEKAKNFEKIAAKAANSLQMKVRSAHVLLYVMFRSRSVYFRSRFVLGTFRLRL